MRKSFSKRLQKGKTWEKKFLKKITRKNVCENKSVRMKVWER
jgi:hypothetical protein